MFVWSDLLFKKMKLRDGSIFVFIDLSDNVSVEKSECYC